jgi:hypothetical protein
MRRALTLRGLLTTLAVPAMVGAVQGLANLNVQHYARGTPLEAILDILRPSMLWLRETTTDPRFLVVTSLLVGGSLFLWADFIIRRWMTWRDSHAGKIDRRLAAMTAVLIFGSGLVVSVIWLAIEVRMNREAPNILQPKTPDAPPLPTANNPPIASDVREFTTRTASELMTLYEGRTPFQADALMQPYKGKWIKINGKVINLLVDGTPGASIAVLKDGNAVVECRLDHRWKCSPSAPMRQTEGLHEGRISGSS